MQFIRPDNYVFNVNLRERVNKNAYSVDNMFQIYDEGSDGSVTSGDH